MSAGRVPRRYDLYLGGTVNYEADRLAVQRIVDLDE
jgi:hypothetical protein